MRPKVVLFGDSITEESFGDGGWGASLADLLRRKADMVLRGYSGYNTRWALKVMERVFPAAGDGGAYPSAVTVFFGANDACLPARCSGFQHVPLLEYKQNLRLIVSFLKFLRDGFIRSCSCASTFHALRLGRSAQIIVGRLLHFWVSKKSGSKVNSWESLSSSLTRRCWANSICPRFGLEGRYRYDLSW